MSVPLNVTTFSSGNLEEYQGGSLLATSILFIVVDILFVGLRIWSRRLASTPLGWDDFLIPPALIMSLAISGIGISKPPLPLYYPILTPHSECQNHLHRLAYRRYPSRRHSHLTPQNPQNHIRPRMDLLHSRCPPKTLNRMPLPPRLHRQSRPSLLLRHHGRFNIHMDSIRGGSYNTMLPRSLCMG